MYKRLAFILAMVFVLAFSVSALAAPPFGAKWVVTYDGYLEKSEPQPGVFTVLADTLIVVNNPSSGVMMPIWIEVYDKHGVSVAESTLYNGGSKLPGNNIPTSGYGWITLGMLVPRATHIYPYPPPLPGGEKFYIRISNNTIRIPPIVEIKQVIYNSPQSAPSEAIWQPANIKTWSETALGGLKGPGITKVPSTMQW